MSNNKSTSKPSIQTVSTPKTTSGPKREIRSGERPSFHAPQPPPRTK